MRRAWRPIGAGPWGPPLLIWILLVASIFALDCGRETPRRSREGAGDGTPAKAPILTVVVPNEPDHLVPQLARSPVSAALWEWVYPSLVRMEVDSTRRGHFVGDLAASWQLDPDRLGIRFFLASDRLWDDTTAVAPEDIVTSYRLYRDPAVAGSWEHRLEEILAVEAAGTSPGTILFHFRRPLSLERALQLAALPVISAQQWTSSAGMRPALGEPGRIPRAAGPFRIDEWQPGDFIRLVRHPFPPAGRIPRADRILIRFVPNGAGRALQVEHGVADIAVDIPAEDVQSLHQGAPDVRLAWCGPVEVEALVWNLGHPTWGRWDLRRAVSAHLDMTRLRRAAAGEAEDAPMLEATGIFEAAEADTLLRAPGTGTVPRPGIGVEPESGTVATPGTGTVAVPDSGAAAAAESGAVAVPESGTAAAAEPGKAAALEPEKAAAAEPGTAAEDSLPSFSFAAYGNPSLEILYDTANARRERIAVEIAVQLDRFGLTTRLLPRTAQECAAQISERRFDAIVMGYAIPAIHDVGEIWQSGGTFNIAGLQARGVDSLVALARSPAADTIPDVWDRVERKAHTYFPFLPIDRRVRIDAIGPAVLGWHADVHDPYGDLLSIERSGH